MTKAALQLGKLIARPRKDSTCVLYAKKGHPASFRACTMTPKPTKVFSVISKKIKKSKYESSQDIQEIRNLTPNLKKIEIFPIII